jgi:acetylornithine deacetylase
MSLDPIQTLAELIAVPSVNPMGGPGAGPEFGEARLTAHLESLLAGLGFHVQRQPVSPGRDNLLARLDGDDSGPVVMFCAHQDTVPVVGMKIPPFTPELRQGRMYGRGACDDKGGLAAMIVAMSRVAELPPGRRPTVLLACTVNEEHGFSGVSALVEPWGVGCRPTAFCKPDVAVVAEPTGLDVVVAHKGVLRWRCHTRGRAAHSSRPELGDNAIYKMGRLLQRIEAYQRDALGAIGSHPLCGPATLSVGMIHGGVSVNTVPDRCTIEIDRRLPPGEDPQGAWRHLVDYLAVGDAAQFGIEHEPPSLCGLPLSDGANRQLAEELGRVAHDVLGAGRPIGVAYATDGASIAAAGVPTVVCGPGSIEQAHTDDEWLSIEQLQAAVEVYTRFLLTRTH